MIDGRRVGMLLLVLLVLSACGGLQPGASNAPAEATIPVQRGSLLVTVGGSGIVEADRTADLSFSTTGVISDVLVEEGDQVEQDQELARLEPELLEVQVATAQAQLSASQAQRDAALAARDGAQTQLESALAARDGAQAQRESAIAARDAAIAQRNSARAQSDRIEEAEDDDDDTAISAQIDTSDAAKEQAEAQIDQAEAQVTQAEAQIDQAETQVTQAEAQIDQAEAQVTQAEAQIRQTDAQIEQAEAQIRQAELGQDQATLRAPFAGVVTTVNIAPGGNSAAGAAGGGLTEGGSSAAISIADTSRYFVEANISEAEIAQVAVDQPAQVTIDALGTEPITSTVEYVAPAATISQNVATYPVRIALPQDIEGVRLGMSASIDIAQEERQAVLIVPNSAIRTEGGRRVVRVQQGEQFVDREIETGLSTDIDTEVVSGLNEGELIATIGIAEE